MALSDEDSPVQDGEDEYSDYNLYFYEGYYAEASEPIEVTLSAVPEPCDNKRGFRMRYVYIGLWYV